MDRQTESGDRTAIYCPLSDHIRNHSSGNTFDMIQLSMVNIIKVVRDFQMLHILCTYHTEPPSQKSLMVLCLHEA